MRDEDTTMTSRTPVDRFKSLRLLGALAGLSVVLGATRATRATLGAGGPPPTPPPPPPPRPDAPPMLPPIRLSYTRFAAVAGPSGLWPEDIGPNFYNSGNNETSK